MRWGSYECIDAELDEGLLTLRLNRPDQLNAVNRQLHGELSRVFIDAAGDPSVEVIVLTGAGRAFCAGGDLNFLQKCIEDPAEFDAVAFEGKQIVYGMLDCEKPVIGRINGHAAGLGATLAVFCDVTFVADHAKISDPHVKVGLVAGDGGAVMWPQLVGFARAKEYLMTGKAISAPEAERIGLINYAVPLDELDARVDEFAQELLGGAASAIRSTKMAINVTLKQLAHASMEASTGLERLSNRSPEHRLAIEAMLRKEAPVFRQG
jgi:enoyl-CoA hydratase